MPDELPMLLTADETAKILRTTRAGVYAMIERGQLPGITRIGRRVLVRSDALLRWLDRNTAPSPVAEPKHPASRSLTQAARQRKF